jgi:hypothetical protein
MELRSRHFKKRSGVARNSQGPFMDPKWTQMIAQRRDQRPPSKTGCNPRTRQEPLDFSRHSTALERFEVLAQVAFLLVSQPQFEKLIVVLDHIRQGRKAAVMIEAALLMAP